MSTNLCWPLLLLLSLSSYLGVRADTPGKLNLYDDWNCNHPSSLNPTVSLSLETCLVHVGCEGLVIRALPPCPESSNGNGTANHIFYSDSACGLSVQDPPTDIISNQCFATYAGVDMPNTRSFMFTCDSPDTNPVPSSTTTVVVSQSAAVASGTNDESSGNSNASPTSAAATPTAGGTGRTEQSSSGASTGAGSQPSTSSPSSTSSASQSPTSSSSSSSSQGGLGTANIIAIAVGVGVGGITIIIGLAAWLVPGFGSTLRRWLCGGSRPTNNAAELSSNSSRVQTVSRGMEENRYMGYHNSNSLGYDSSNSLGNTHSQNYYTNGRYY